MSATFRPHRNRQKLGVARVSPRSWYEDDLDGRYPGNIGAAHSVGGDGPERDVVSELRAVVEEVTRKPLPAVVRKIGFI